MSRRARQLSRCLDCGYEKHEPSEKLNHTTRDPCTTNRSTGRNARSVSAEIEGTRGEHRYEWDDGLQDWACTCGYTHKEVCKGTLEAILDLVHLQS